MLSVSMRDTSQEPKPVCDKICSLLRTHFLGYGYNGAWSISLHKKMDGTTRLQYLRQTPKGKGVIYFVRPGTDPSGWEVSVLPPSHISPGSVERREIHETNLAKKSGIEVKEQKQEAPSPTEPENNRELTLNVGQMCIASVLDHLEHGMNVEVATKTGPYRGYINLADISPTFDQKELLKYPVGKTIRVIIGEIDENKKKITCSIRTEGIASTASKDDLFTGIPDKDGVLFLGGFTKDISRTYKVLEWLLILAPDHYPDPIPHEIALNWVIENLKTEYKVDSIEKRSISPIFVAMSTGTEPLITKTQNPWGYLITDFGWQEGGGKEKWLAGYVPEPKEEPSPTEELLPPLPDHVVNLPPEHPRVTSENDSVLEEIEPEEIKPMPQAELPPIRGEKGVCLDDVVSFLGKCVRRHTIQEQLTQLNREAQELDEWLAKNKHLREAAARMVQKDSH